MRIVHQSELNSYSLLPENPPLLLSAPKIAGLLPAKTEHKNRQEESPTAFTYHNSTIATLSSAQFNRFSEAAARLLDAAIAALTGGINEDELRTAEARFHLDITGKPIRTSQLHLAELDADLIMWMEDSAARMASARRDSEREMAQWMRKGGRRE